MKPEWTTHLVANGWRECPHPLEKDARHFYKRFDTPTRCQCNDNKPGMQVCVAVWPRGGYEIELSGELTDGTWLKVFQWAMPDDIEQGLQVIGRMLATWEFAANWKD